VSDPAPPPAPIYAKVWDLSPDNGSQPCADLLPLSDAGERVERDSARYRFVIPGEPIPERVEFPKLEVPPGRFSLSIFNTRTRAFGTTAQQEKTQMVHLLNLVAQHVGSGKLSGPIVAADGNVVGHFGFGEGALNQT
jgi:hypothetical protein